MDFLGGLFRKDTKNIELREREVELTERAHKIWLLLVNESGIDGKEPDADTKIKKLKGLDMAQTLINIAKEPKPSEN